MFDRRVARAIDVALDEFEMTPSLLMQYAQMTKNEVFLHMAIKALAEDGKILRNVNQICQLFSKSTQRMLDAEFGLKHRGLLRIHWGSSKRYWYVYDSPVGQEELIPTPPAPTLVEVSEPKKPSLLKRLKYLITGVELDNFDLVDEAHYQERVEEIFE
ncbi:hypothetical protein IH992_16980 [Candidatus Poribacteria bacterium]|nr:hypothetical protein [Candidatus Poribacteria bacterium]